MNACVYWKFTDSVEIITLSLFLSFDHHLLIHIIFVNNSTYFKSELLLKLSSIKLLETFSVIKFTLMSSKLHLSSNGLFFANRLDISQRSCIESLRGNPHI